MRSLIIIVNLIVLTFIVSESYVQGQIRVIGGKPATLTMFPYQAFLEMVVASHIYNSQTGKYQNCIAHCGGSLISKNFILTAAHCLKYNKPLYFSRDGSLQTSSFVTVTAIDAAVFLGVAELNNIQKHPTQVFTNLKQNHFIIHPKFRYNPSRSIPAAFYDIALIRLPKQARVDGYYIKPVQLPTSQFYNVTGAKAISTGFGLFNEPQNTHLLKKSEVLRYTNIVIASNVKCNIQKELDQLCTAGTSENGNVGTCSSDSGGPLVIRSNKIDIQVGITSYGLGNCTNGLPSYYTRVSSYIGWIQENTDISY